MMGWDDTVWNHITARTPETDHTFFMHQFGLVYEEVKASNLIKVDENGKVLEGPSDVNTAGFIIHSAVHLNHPNNKFVFHAHPPKALAATALKNGIPHLVQDSSMLYGKVGYHDWEGLSVDKDERFRIAENLGENKVLIMRNHGLLTIGETAGESFMNMYYAVRMCEVAVQAQSSNLELKTVSKELWEKSQKQYDAFFPGPNEWPALLRRCDAIDSSYKE
jgi:ribulose-5-phosphate 4-epimerase/fuculose-1-phosphate aldolase